jgi:hypothetical protein
MLFLRIYLNDTKYELFLQLSNAIRQFDMYNILLSSLILYGYLIYMFVGNFLVGSYTEHSDKILDAT